MTGLLRPVVHSQTIKYNSMRIGYGFTHEELQAAGINDKLAPTIGIAVDGRRNTRGNKSLTENVARLNNYLSKLAPSKYKPSKPRSDSDKALQREELIQAKGVTIPIKSTKTQAEFLTLTEEMRRAKAYSALRIERMNARFEGR